jgi:hypothetical protein
VVLIAAVILVASAMNVMAVNSVVDNYVDVNTLNINYGAGDNLTLEKAGIVHCAASGGTLYSAVYNYVSYACDGSSWDQGGITSAEGYANNSRYAIGILTGDQYNNANGNDFMMGNPVVTSRYPSGNILATDAVVMNTYFGDLDLSGTVDYGDFSVFMPHYLSRMTGATWADGDFDYSGQVDYGDFASFMPLYLSRATNPVITNSSGDITEAPEPATIVMLLTALGAALSVFAKKRV